MQDKRSYPFRIGQIVGILGAIGTAISSFLNCNIFKQQSQICDGGDYYAQINIFGLAGLLLLEVLFISLQLCFCCLPSSRPESLISYSYMSESKGCASFFQGCGWFLLFGGLLPIVFFFAVPYIIQRLKFLRHHLNLSEEVKKNLN